MDWLLCAKHCMFKLKYIYFQLNNYLHHIVVKIMDSRASLLGFNPLFIQIPDYTK